MLCAAALSAQRLTPPPVNFKPQLQPPATAASAPSNAPPASKPAPPKAAAAPQANQIPGQQFTPMKPAAPVYSPERAAHDLQVGDFYFRRQDYHGALSRYQGALSHQPDLPAALWGCARAAYRLHDNPLAETYLRRYLAVAPAGREAKNARKLLARLDPRSDR